MCFERGLNEERVCSELGDLRNRGNLMIGFNNFYLQGGRNKSTRHVICKCKEPHSEPRERSILDYFCGNTVSFSLAYV